MVLSHLRSSGSVEFGTCIEFLQNACNKHLPKVAKGNKQKEDWFDSNGVVFCELVRQRGEARQLFLVSRSVVLKKCHRRWSTLVRERERMMRDTFWSNLAREIQSSNDKRDTKAFFAAIKLVYGG
jgi:hypothetical protein